MPLDPEAFADMVIQTVDTALGPERERLAVVEALLKTLGDLRDRVVQLETKAAVPPPPLPTIPDLVPVLERLAVVETKIAMPVLPLPPEAGMDDLVDRLVTVKMKALQGERGPVGERGPEGPPGPSGPPGRDGRDGIQGAAGEKGLDGLRGTDGAPGRDGINGKDGAPGLSFEGVYQEGKHYEPGQLATWAGSSWHCNEPTTSKPGEGTKAWTLMVKRGRDGKDGRDAPTLPIVTVGGGR